MKEMTEKEVKELPIKIRKGIKKDECNCLCR